MKWFQKRTGERNGGHCIEMGLLKNFAIKAQEEGAVDGSRKGDRSCVFSRRKLKSVYVSMCE